MKLTLLLIPLLLLSSCTIDWNDEKDNIFEKNKECVSQQKNAQTQLESIFFAKGTSNLIISSFYSKMKNSCIFTGRVTTGSFESEVTFDYTDIKNYFSKSINCIEAEICPKNQEEYNKKLKELKGE